MAEPMVCPFFNIEEGGYAENCAKNKCALWIGVEGREETLGACSFRVMAARLSAIEERLNTIAMQTK